MKINHIGFVVENIAKSCAIFCDLYGYQKDSEIVFDLDRNVKLVLLSSLNNYCIELIQPLDEKSPSYDFMKKGGGFHHICYEVNNLSDAIVAMQNNNHMLVRRPKPAVLFNNRKVAFLYSKFDRQIIELIEDENSC